MAETFTGWEYIVWDGDHSHNMLSSLSLNYSSVDYEINDSIVFKEGYGLKFGVRVDNNTGYWRFKCNAFYGYSGTHSDSSAVGVSRRTLYHSLWKDGNQIVVGTIDDPFPKTGYTVLNSAQTPPLVYDFDPTTSSVVGSLFHGHQYFQVETNLVKPRPGRTGFDLNTEDFGIHFDPAQETLDYTNILAMYSWPGAWFNQDTSSYVNYDELGIVTTDEVAWPDFDTQGVANFHSYIPFKNFDVRPYLYGNAKNWINQARMQHANSGIAAMCQKVVKGGAETATDPAYRDLVRQCANRILIQFPLTDSTYPPNAYVNFDEDAFRGRGRALAALCWLWKATLVIKNYTTTANDPYFNYLNIKLAARVIDFFTLTVESQLAVTWYPGFAGGICNNGLCIATWELFEWFYGLYTFQQLANEIPGTEYYIGRAEVLMKHIAIFIHDDQLFNWSVIGHPWDSNKGPGLYPSVGWCVPYRYYYWPNQHYSEPAAGTDDVGLGLLQWLYLSGYKDPTEKIFDASANSYSHVGYRWQITETFGNQEEPVTNVFPDPIHIQIKAPLHEAIVTQTVNPKFPYFEKNDKVLDYMGIAVSANNPSQRIWAPGFGVSSSNLQEYPGGWVTPGDYTLTINTSAIHTLQGERTGVDRGDELFGLIISSIEYPTNDGWIGHGKADPNAANTFGGQNYTPSNLGTTTSITLNAWDTLHIGYSSKIIGDGQTGRVGSDGFEVYCVPDTPYLRGGLAGQFHPGFSEIYDAVKWDTFVARCNHLSTLVNLPSVSDDDYGPSSLPTVLPSDYQASTGDPNDCNIAANLGKWLFNRAVYYIVNGDHARGDDDDFETLLRYACNIQGTTTCFSDYAETYHYAHGNKASIHRQAADNRAILIAAALLGYNPSYEYIRRIMSWFAQRQNMSMAYYEDYYYENATHDGGISNHIPDSIYTQWIWNDKSQSDINSSGIGKSLSVWSLSTWCRKVLSYPLSPLELSVLHTYSGRNGLGASAWVHQEHEDYDANDLHGHGALSNGITGGYNASNATQNILGRMWLKFTDTEPESQMVRWGSRNIIWGGVSESSGLTKDPDGLIDESWATWALSSFIPEVSGVSSIQVISSIELSGTPNFEEDTEVGLVKVSFVSATWATHPDPNLDHYEVWAGDNPSSMVLSATTSSTSIMISGATTNDYLSIKAVTTSGPENDNYDSFISEPLQASDVDVYLEPIQIPILLGNPEVIVSPIENISIKINILIFSPTLEYIGIGVQISTVIDYIIRY